MDKLNVEILEDRKIQLCKNFARKTAAEPKFKRWFKTGGPIKSEEKK